MMTTAILLSGALALAAAADQPLNLLIITADDMNADSSGWMGSKLGLTPNLDAFAAKGFCFEQCHSTVSICQPSRSALMTGRVPHRNGAMGFEPIHKSVPTLVEILKNRGYFTATINKIAHMQPPNKFPWDAASSGSGKNPDVFRRALAEILRTAAASKKPFFINANITDPHRPFPKVIGQEAEAKDELNGSRIVRIVKPEEVRIPSVLEDLPAVREEIAQYATAVARFDLSFGEIMNLISAGGYLRNTVVIFLSDHGMSFPFSKATVYRNGAWTPVIFFWPGLPSPKTDRTHLVSTVDIMPTLLELLKAPPPPGMDGSSLVPLMHGETTNRDAVVTHFNSCADGLSFPQRCIRTQTRSLIFQSWSNGRKRFRSEALTSLSYKAMVAASKSDSKIAARVHQYRYGAPLAFYDLERDPDERVNLIHDPSRKSEIDLLSHRLLAHMARTNDPQLEPFKKALFSQTGNWDRSSALRPATTLVLSVCALMTIAHRLKKYRAGREHHASDGQGFEAANATIGRDQQNSFRQSG